jgi:hypothetical protein
MKEEGGELIEDVFVGPNESWDWCWKALG